MRRTEDRVRVGLTMAFAFGFLVCVLLPAVARAGSAWQVSAGQSHSCVVTGAGGVMCWGANGDGRLGSGTTTSSSTPVDVIGLSGGVVVVGVGVEHSCALTADGGVKCWGKNYWGQLGDGTATSFRTTPADVSGLTSGVVALSVGWAHTCALTTAGSVKCWGWNGNGQLGDGTTTDRSTPTTVIGVTGLSAVSAGYGHTCAVTTAGAAKCWGLNTYFQLGDGTTTNRSSPVNVSGLAAGVLALGCGGTFTCALTTTGGVRCWGSNALGQLGDGTTTDRPTPTQVSGLATGVAAFGVGGGHACAVTSAGGLKCWGSNQTDQLGDGSTTNRSTPVEVVALESGIAAVSLGTAHTCALGPGGGVRCWGLNDQGQLGDGSTTNRPTPVDAHGFTGGGNPPVPGVQQVALGTGGFHTCAVTNSGGVECWGRNTYGQLGDGTTTSRVSPVGVRGLASGVVAVATGSSYSCALTAAGGVKCWGDNAGGRLGDGTTTERHTPVDTAGLASGVVMLRAGQNHACAVTATGGVKCWGDNTHGQIGDGSTTSRSIPTDVSGLTAGVAGLSTGTFHTCAVTTAGAAKCWGENADGRLGDGTTTDPLVPVWVNGLGFGVAAVSAGGAFTCALTGGAVRCWGDNVVGQVGDGTTTDRPTPVSVSGLAGGVAAISAGFQHACAVTNDGRTWCWGGNTYGAIGDNTTAHRTTPVTPIGLAAGVVSVTGGLYCTCALTSGGGVQCWGHNLYGQLGDRTTTNRSTPGWVAGHVAGAGRTASGSDFGCRLTGTDGVQCWGNNAYGQLGDGTTTNHLVPVDVAGLASGVVAVAAGQFHACAVTNVGALKCWGSNIAGELGDGTTTNRSTPVAVSGRGSGTMAIALGRKHTCAVTVVGGVQCWGMNTAGQLGDGTYTARGVPGWVLGLTTGVTSVTVGSGHACALTRGGGVKCWGSNSFGQLGDGTTTGSRAPVPVEGLAAGVHAISSHGNAQGACALMATSVAKCWGRNTDGQLGDSTTTDSSTPVDAGGLGSGLAEVAMAGDFACALTTGGGVKCVGLNSYGQLGNGSTTSSVTAVSVTGLESGTGALAASWYQTCAATAAGGVRCWGRNYYGQLGDGTLVNRSTPVAVRGFKQQDDYDADSKADASVYRPSTGTWFSLDSSSGNSSYQYRGWGVQASGDVPVSGCDFDGDGVVDPTVFRPSAGTWFILKSSTAYTTWEYVGWGTTGDTPVPSDYDGDGLTDAAVYHPATGTWYVRPSSGATQWNVAFGNSTDVPIPGSFDADGKADIAVYRPTTGTWFVLTSASDYTDYWYQGWGVNALGDAPAPGDYDGDGKLDLCVFRPTTGTWFVLESHAGFTTWSYVGWGQTSDTVVPADYDGDGITDAAVYRPSNYTWYVRPSSGAAQWSVAFGASGDLPLVGIR